MEKNEHEATAKIGKEIGVSDLVYSLLSKLGGNGLSEAAESNNYNLKVCFYSDLRCGPFGILNVNKRFDDLLERYKGRNHPVANVERTEKNRKITLIIEKQLQKYVLIDLSSINDAMIADEIETLKNYDIN